ncbi:DUF2520 domain-containing protein [Leucobacter luti]|uniref:Putative short-subunit dehydrogenase-like oxidoreductase (DUF2520 family) n=1 Tax=Leucobacter luti TaxID=340320 RepID=A0A4Q7TPT0_9MICO|nr:DUF2520 domain-containing protein [Leucobacter luti]MBL3699898.1 DUF2520 domain-containing protein [Leucobacter luti]RZT62784.1 putative short-subunit dehydrogenase-like oxidoreductase (DUF2520 family) [Leucobacter luti]
MRIQIVGWGRMGAALHASLAAAGAGDVLLPLAGRGADGSGADLVLLAVPDAAIADAARLIAPGPLVGHLSGMTTLAALAPHEALSVHPLLSVTGPDTAFAGAHAAVAGTSERALATARSLAETLGLVPFTVADEDRAAYHAAASISANALVAIEWVAERLAATAGVPRAALAPLARAALDNWAARGAAAALTGPIARGDEATVSRQRDALAARLPDELGLFDALTQTTRALAAHPAEPTEESR